MCLDERQRFYASRAERLIQLGVVGHCYSVGKNGPCRLLKRISIPEEKGPDLPILQAKHADNYAPHAPALAPRYHVRIGGSL